MPRTSVRLVATALLAAPAALLWPDTVIQAPTTDRPAAAQHPAVFVPNQGQWDHPATFVHQSGGMTMFMDSKGWVMDMPEGMALGMRFVGSNAETRIEGEAPLAARHHYFLGKQPSRWRTDVPLFASLLYQDLYEGIDLRLRQAAGAPEYDLLLQPGATLQAVRVAVQGCDRLSIDGQGDLLVHTSRGVLRQPRPKTWQLTTDGTKQLVNCDFRLLGPRQFGFSAPDWNPSRPLTIDPGLLWSSFVGGSSVESAVAVTTDRQGRVLLAGHSYSSKYPTTLGAYDPSANGMEDAVLTRLDPSKTGSAQLVDATFFGGKAQDRATGIDLDDDGLIYLCGTTQSTDMPTSSGAFDKSHARDEDGFVLVLDLGQKGSNQLVYASYFGGDDIDKPIGIQADAKGRITIAGETYSSNLPSSSGSYASSGAAGWNLFAARLDPGKSGAAGLGYGSYLGGSGREFAKGLALDAAGVITIAGYTDSHNYPTSSGALQSNRGGVRAMVVSQLDPSKNGPAQLRYSTYLGGSGDDRGFAVDVSAGIITVGGYSNSKDLPTAHAYSGSNRGGTTGYDAYLARLDPSRSGASQLVYASYFGGKGDDRCYDLSADPRGVVTLCGETYSSDLPATAGAADQSYNGHGDVFVARFDTRASGSQQLRACSYLGGSAQDAALGLDVDGGMVATVTGLSASAGLPTSSGAFDRSYNGKQDIFASRLELDSDFRADAYELELNKGGVQELQLMAGKAHAGMSYAIFGSVTGSHPGIKLGGLHIPLNVDPYTDITVGSALPPVFFGFRGKLDGSGKANATIKVPALKGSFVPFDLHHAYIVVDAKGNFVKASRAVPLRLR